MKLVLAALALFVCLFGVVWLGTRFDLHRYYSLGSAVLVWLVTYRDNRPLFRFGWFWWASLGFIVGSTLVVNLLELAPPGANLMRWLLILMTECAVFVVALLVLKTRNA